MCICVCKQTLRERERERDRDFFLKFFQIKANFVKSLNHKMHSKMQNFGAYVFKKISNIIL